MLAVPTDFPHPGSRAFVKGTAEPVTIIRHNRDPDRTALVRRDPRARERASRDASGNRTELLANLCATEDEAAGLKQRSDRPTKTQPAPKARRRRSAGKGKA
ncbi:hypothetical protein [Qipengyuania sp.]|uniref:hypothetical protein n=1 Tax=Qipengyuania sp. TaxID=2004515 RepID=UPI0035C7FFB3